MPFAIAFLAFAVYLPSLRNGYIWDDEQYVTANSTLRSPQGLVDIWLTPTATPQYYPLVHSSFWIEFHLWGLNPVGFHLDNILLHAAACVLLLGVLRRLQIPGAEWAAALFAVHPVMVESVAWITERKNVLSAVFTLLAMRSALVVWQLGDAPLSRRACSPGRRRWRYATCALFFTAALLSKTVACTFPVAVALLTYWRRGRLRIGEVLSLLPLIILGGVFGLFTAYLERHHVGASGAEWQLSIAQRLLLAGRVVWFYVGKLMWPSPLIFIYPRWTLQPSDPLQWIAPAGVVAVGIGLWVARQRSGRGPAVLATLFVATLLPALGFINVFPFRYSFVADHFQYLAAVAIFVAAGWAWSHVPRAFALPGGAVVLVVLAILTWRRQAVYENLQTLWSDTLQQNPAAWIASNNLAMLKFDAGDREGAVRDFDRAAAAYPAAPGLQANLGAALLSLHRAADAATPLSLAVTQDPTDAIAWRDLGTADTELGRDAAAKIAYERSLELDPHDSQTSAGLAWIEATSSAADVRDPIDAIAHAAQAETDSHGYSIRAVEARAAAEAALGQRAAALRDAQRAAAMASAAGDGPRADEIRRRAETYAAKTTSKP